MKAKMHHALNTDVKTEYSLFVRFHYFTLFYVTNQNVINKDNKWLFIDYKNC